MIKIPDYKIRFRQLKQNWKIFTNIVFTFIKKSNSLILSDTTDF